MCNTEGAFKRGGCDGVAGGGGGGGNVFKCGKTVLCSKRQLDGEIYALFIANLRYLKFSVKFESRSSYLPRSSEKLIPSLIFPPTTLRSSAPF